VERAVGACARQEAAGAFRLPVARAEAASVVALLVPATQEVVAEAVRPKAGVPVGARELAGVSLAGVLWRLVLAWQRTPVSLGQAPEPRPRPEAD
jgi:hypothetical protein